MPRRGVQSCRRTGSTTHRLDAEPGGGRSWDRRRSRLARADADGRRDISRAARDTTAARPTFARDAPGGYWGCRPPLPGGGQADGENVPADRSGHEHTRITSMPDNHIATLARSPVKGSSVWFAADMRGREAEWSYRLSSSEAAETEAALAHVRSRNLDIADIRREDFPLPTLGPVLERLRAEALDGRGFVLLRGMPVDDRPIAEI